MPFPKKIREIHNHHFDSTIWNEFVFRDDDIVIATYAKSGSTWVQQIIAQLLFDGEEDLEVAEMSPWIDLRVPPKDIKLPLLEAQTHRRFVKTHLPVDALVFTDKAKYIYIGRDGRDIVWSLFNHHSKANNAWYAGLNKTAGRIGPPIERPPASIRQYYHEWLDRDGYPFWPYWEHVRSWWAVRNLPNVLLIHFANLKQDMPGVIRQIAQYLKIAVEENRWETIVSHCSFDYMRANASKSVPFGGALWKGGVQSFFHKGTNGRWREVLNTDEIEKYNRFASRKLSTDCAHWLATGQVI